jgi:hypothetical protein
MVTIFRSEPDPEMYTIEHIPPTASSCLNFHVPKPLARISFQTPPMPPPWLGHGHVKVEVAVEFQLLRRGRREEHAEVEVEVEVEKRGEEQGRTQVDAEVDEQVEIEVEVEVGIRVEVQAETRWKRQSWVRLDARDEERRRALRREFAGCDWPVAVRAARAVAVPTAESVAGMAGERWKTRPEVFSRVWRREEPPVA